MGFVVGVWGKLSVVLNNLFSSRRALKWSPVIHEIETTVLRFSKEHPERRLEHMTERARKGLLTSQQLDNLGLKLLHLRRY